ncbi:MAG TPA: DUF433 domain-containing protein [Gaiellaceae bacterium]
MSELLAFTAEHVARLTGLSQRQLRYWDTTGFFAPTLLHDHRQRTFGRIYSFRDVVGLRVIAILRKKVPLQELRRVGKWLREHEREHDTPWSSLRLALFGKEVVFFEPETGRPVVPRGRGQYLMQVELEPIANEMRSEAAKLRERRADQLGRIVRNRYVVHNAHVLSGTRIPTSAIWSFHSAGYSVDAIIAEYPRLTPDDVRAAIAFETERHTAA